jgi:hypothetical protein
VLLSHRPTTLPLSDARLVLHRVIAPTFLIRYAELHGIVQDERFTKLAVGIDSEKRRQRLTIPLEGTFRDFLSREELAVGPGTAAFIPETVVSNSRCSGSVLELEWDAEALDGASEGSATILHLSARARNVARGFAQHLTREVAGSAMRPQLAKLLHALRAEGLPFALERMLASPDATPKDQALMNELDAALSNLQIAPMLVDLEARTGMAQRTLTRNIRSLHERYALLGRGEGQWRGMRDVTPRHLAKIVGYGSVEALDHAFRNAALRSPAELGRAVRAA